MIWTRRNVLAGSGVALAGVPLSQVALAAGSPDGEAKSVLQRLLGNAAAAFDLELVADAAPQPWFAAKAMGGKVHIAANSSIGLARGAYAYLTATGTAQFSWEGCRVVPPAQWPAHEIARSESFFRHRAYLNPCTYGYTAPFWDWARWEREIDWMALHGIDMPLAMEGQEYVWRQLWSDAGLTEKDLEDYFCGPAFLPWQRMGNIEGYGGPLPMDFIQKKHALQLRILDRMGALGMTPVLPGFAGYVPKAFALRHPEARIHKMAPWGGFHETYWLDPTDPLFAKLARGYLDRYTAIYGRGSHYLADAFNEMRPPVEGLSAEERQKTLARYGRSLYEALEAASPGAVLTMQGWLFGIDPQFWDEASIAAFLRDIPDGKLLVLDIANDTYPGVWEKTKAFSGKPWVYGYIHNFGGNNPVFGDLGQIAGELAALPRRQDTGRLEGFGAFPEGLNTNSIVYEAMFDQAWPAAGAPARVEDWLAQYLRARYGETDAELLAAWGLLWRSAYQTANWWPIAYWKGSFGQYLFCKRPDEALAKVDKELTDVDGLGKAIGALLRVAPRYRQSELFRYDVVAASAHYGSLIIDRQLRAMLTSFADWKNDDAMRVWRKIQRLALAIDGCLGVLPWSLETWIAQAELYGATDADRALYRKNAKTQITIWGGDAVLKDYASKAWAGLYRHFYLPRWGIFVRSYRRGGDSAKVAEKLLSWETAWAKSPKTYRVKAPIGVYDDLARLYAECERR